MKLKTILAPTDFSKFSVYGLELAAVLARKTGAVLHIFNTSLTNNYYYSANSMVITPPAALLMASMNENLNKAVDAELNELKKKSFLKGLKLVLKSEVSSNIHFSILDYSDKIKADMIVMGTKGSGNLKSILLGSTAERIVRFSEKPVLVVPGKVKIPVLKKIVFASDFSNEAYGIFPVIKDFAGLFKSDIHLLKINTMDQFSRTKDDLENINKFSKKFGNKFTVKIYNDYMKEEGILNYSREIKADLIAIGTHGKKGLRRFFSEDVSEGIVRLALRPILVVNLKKYKSKSDIY